MEQNAMKIFILSHFDYGLISEKIINKHQLNINKIKILRMHESYKTHVIRQTKKSSYPMDEETSEVVLLGYWASSYCTKVELALKLKGIPYKYVEEDLRNKSDSLLKYNPVHKKVPTLLHKGRSICESQIILEYIDEIWDHSPKLLPEDPYQRAKVRFWANYYDQKVHIIHYFRSTFLLYLRCCFYIFLHIICFLRVLQIICY